MGALYKGFVATAILSLAAMHPVTDYVIGLEKVYKVAEQSFTGNDLFYCAVIGLVITG